MVSRDVSERLQLIVWSLIDPRHLSLRAAGPTAAAGADGGGRVRRQLAERGVRAFFQMVLVDNFVHADLHPVGTMRLKLIGQK